MIFLFFFVVLHLVIASQAYLLCRDIVNGDGSCDELKISLRYPPMRVPATLFTVQHQAQGRLCADFGQIYFPSQNRTALRDAYAIETTLDPWLRPSKYPPLLHVICVHTLSKLPYGQASLIHLAVQTILFIASFAFAFSVLNLKKYLLPSLLLLNVCLFLTPVGLSFFERGQFTLYVGLCYLWLMLALVTGKWRYVIVSALFGFVKWTAFPFVFVALAVCLLISRNARELKLGVVAVGLYILTILALLFSVPNDAVLFIQLLLYQELALSPMGISLARIVPRYTAKLLPYVLIFAGLLNRFSSNKPLPYLIPFFAGAATILVTYPTFAFDYSVPCLTAFIPFMIYWAKLPGIGRAMGWIVQGLFYAFLLLASFAQFVFNGSEAMVIMTYVIAAIALISAPFLVDIRSRIPETTIPSKILSTKEF